MSRMMCIVYVSEGLRAPIISRLRETASEGGILANSFVDAVYGRTSFYLIGGDLVQRSIKLCKEAYSLVNFKEHTGSHPALGTVDHVSFSPLGPGTSLDETKEVARTFATQLHSSEGIPIYYYGEASKEKAKLKDIRHQLGYFDYPSDGGAASKETFLLNLAGKMTELEPSVGSKSDFAAERGLMCVGAVNYVQNFNMRFRQEDSRKAVMRVTKAVRSSSVESLTLQHEDGAYEVACNLLQPLTVTPEMVLATATAASTEAGVEIAMHYTTGPTEARLIELADSAAR